MRSAPSALRVVAFSHTPELPATDHLSSIRASFIGTNFLLQFPPQRAICLPAVSHCRECRRCCGGVLGGGEASNWACRESIIRRSGHAVALSSPPNMVDRSQAHGTQSGTLVEQRQPRTYQDAEAALQTLLSNCCPSARNYVRSFRWLTVKQRLEPLNSLLTANHHHDIYERNMIEHEPEY